MSTSTLSVSILPGVIRTAVPAVVGWALGFPVVQGLGLTEEMVTPLVSAVVAIVYYIAVRLLERYVPQFGWLLGYAAQPVYAPIGSDGAADVSSLRR